jgi:hypothetical protein
MAAPSWLVFHGLSSYSILYTFSCITIIYPYDANFYKGYMFFIATILNLCSAVSEFSDFIKIKGENLANFDC